MLFDQEQFDSIEQEMQRQGIYENFEREKGKIKGRMMIDLIEPPVNLELEIPEGAFCFGASFDFYDMSIGFVFDPGERKALSGLWCAPQKEGAEEPAREWMEFFVKTLIENLEPESFGVPMFTFISDICDFTVTLSE